MRCDGTNGLTLRACDQAIRLRLKKTYCLAAVLLSFTSRSDEYAAAPATMILAAMTGLEWIITPYVIQKRAATDWIQRSFAGYFEKYEIVNNAVALQPTPSAPISALASAISTSLTCSTVPPVASRTRTAFFHEAGLPMRMAVAMVSARIGESFFPPFSRMARTSGFAPSA